MRAREAHNRGSTPDAGRRAWRDRTRLGALLAAALALATPWDGCRAEEANRGEARPAARDAAGPSQWPIAVGLLIALAGAATGAALARRRCRSHATPKTPPLPKGDWTTLRAVLLGTTEAVVLADPRGAILMINPAAEILFRCLGEDVVGTGVRGMFPQLGDAQAVDDIRAQLDAAGDPTVAPAVRETWGRRADGEEFPVRLWVRGLPLDGDQYLLVTIQDMDEQEQHAEAIAYLRTRDQLTGLLNRQEFYARLARIAALPDAGNGRGEGETTSGAAAGSVKEQANGAESRTPEPPDDRGAWALCQLDLDQFAVINNTVGHAAGDKLLQQVARLIQAQMAPAELVARSGADEFAVLLKGVDIDAAIDLSEGLMQTMRGFLFTWHDRSYEIPLSIGIAAWHPATQSMDDALARADAACRLAKVGGRNRIRVYREGDDEAMRLRGDMHLVSTINEAIATGSFDLFAQPIVPIGDDAPVECHYEILVRMFDGSGTLVVPSRFIPAAEHYILMPMVDRWIISRLFALQAENLRAWHQTHPNQFLFAVNLSGTTVTDEGFIRYLRRQFQDWEVPYASICFEITETSAVASLDLARAFIEEMSALGCRFALDDFGTGVSSYAYLRELGVHYLKIDGSFVRGVADDEINRAMVESINHIGHVLGLKTIAEWVENDRILAVLRAMQVDYAQGYGVGAAVAVTDFTLEHAANDCRLERPSHEQPATTH